MSITACGAKNNTPKSADASTTLNETENLTESQKNIENSKDEVVKNTETNSSIQAKTPDSFNLETKTVRLNSGYDMPIVGLGTYSLSDEECYNSVLALLENGGRLIDTAY